MEETKPKNINSRRMDLMKLKKELGLDKIPVIRQPIKVKKDGKHLYQVAGFTYPLRPETIERLNIPPQKILFEVDREQWHREMDEAREKLVSIIDKLDIKKQVNSEKQS